MFKKLKIKRGIIYSLLAVGMFTLIGFVESKEKETRVKNVVINIDHEGNNYFVEEEDVMDLMTRNGADLIVDKKYAQIDLKEIELRVKSFKFVQDAQVSKDHKGNVTVLVKQRRPIARIIQSNGSHAYIGADGTTLSTSEKYTSRVVVIDGDFTSKLLSEEYLTKEEEGKKYFDLLKKIDQDKFWKTMIAQLTISKNGEIQIYPQLGDQVIEIGKPDDLDLKLRNMALFYTKILPAKGWGSYKNVNLKYKDQIICE